MISSLIKRLFSTKSFSPASARASKNSNIVDDDDNDDDDVLASSYCQKTVCLYNWWLVRADKDYEGKRLAVAGFTSRELQAMRVFTSAPIVKSYDPFSLETSDGIYIIIKGLINKSRTMENGFSSEVFSHFNLGFHRDWEAHADKCFVKEFREAAAADPKSDEGVANSNSNSIPVDHKNVKGKNKHNAGDAKKSADYVSENNPANASNISDSPGHAADLNGVGNHALKNLPPLRTCDIMSVCSLEKNSEVSLEISISHMLGSSERMSNLKRTGNTETTTESKLKTLERQEKNDKCKDGLNSDNITSKLISIVCGLKPEGSKMGSVSVLSDDTRNIGENDNLCGELQEQGHSAIVRNKLKARGCKTILHSGTRQKTNKFAKSSCVPGDMDHGCNLRTAFDERERNVSSRKKVARKINFDAHASPHTEERKEKFSIVSPESLSLKRSRSGPIRSNVLHFGPKHNTSNYLLDSQMFQGDCLYLP